MRGGKNDDRNLNFWGAIGDWFTGCPSGNEGDDCSVVCHCSGQNTCEAWTHVCRAPGKHGDYCHLTRPCGNAYWCVDAISAWNHQICLPECTSISSEMKTKLKDVGYSTDTWPGFGLKWDNGVVPFVFDCDLENHEQALFSEAMKEIEDKTGIQFIRYNSKKHANYIVLTDQISGAASSWVGKMRQPGWQRVNLDTAWMGTGDYTVGTAIHELMHALGWQHTQCRPDRDQFVTVNEGNIQDDKKPNFVKQDSDVFEKVQKCRSYNYDSIMHYTRYAFSKDGSDTITTKDSGKQDVIGNRDKLTAQDIDEIKTYYFGNTSCATTDTYDFRQGKDSPGADIERYWFEGITIDQMKARCDAYFWCRGFNSNGWMKFWLAPENQWSHWTSDPTKGFYIKV